MFDLQKIIIYIIVLFLFPFLLPFLAKAQNGRNPAFRFVENKQNWGDEVGFRTKFGGGYVYLRRDGPTYVFYDGDAVEKAHHGGAAVQNPGGRAAAPGRIGAQGVAVRFVGADPAAEIRGEEVLPGRFYSYLNNNAPEPAQAFGRLVYREFYPKTDLIYSEKNGNLKYEFYLRPGAEASKILAEYQGASDLKIAEDGSLIVRTAYGEVREKAPFCYQLKDGLRIKIKSAYRLINKQLSFDFPDGYDKNLPLIIDPELVFASYSGSVSDNWGNTAAFDEAGRLVAAGIVFGRNFPATSGAFDVDFAGMTDVAVLKFSEDGADLVYAAFLGGEGSETPHSCLTDSDGRLIIFGSTSSTNFPTTVGAFDRSFNGGDPSELSVNGGNPDPIGGVSYLRGSDIYVSILSGDGSRLLASTYLGGSGNDGILLPGFSLVQNYGDQYRGSVETDAAGNIWLASTTRSANFPTTGTAADRAIGGTQDAVLVQFDKNLSALRYSTFYGGGGHDAAYSLKISPADEVYICGGTNSSVLPTAGTGFKQQFGGATDGFAAKFSAGGQFLAGTYLGTSRTDQAYFLDLDKEGGVYVFGTTSGNYPISDGVYSNSSGGQFLQKLTPDLSRSVFSSRLGDASNSAAIEPDISPTAFSVSDCGHIYFAGWGGRTNTTSGFPSGTQNMPVTPDAIKSTTDGDDFYVAILDKNATGLLYGTFYGGSSTADGDHVDGGTSRFDKNGTIYHAVCACRTNNVPTTAGVWSETNKSENTLGCNTAVFKLEINALKANFETLDAAGNPVSEGCAPLTVFLDNRSQNGLIHEWDLANLGKKTQDIGPSVTFTEAGTYILRLKVTNERLCLPPDYAYDTLKIYKAEITVSSDTAICYGETVQLIASGGTTYEWTPADGLDDPDSARPFASPTETTTYKVKISNPTACDYEEEIRITVADRLQSAFELQLEDLCDEFPTVRPVNKSVGAGDYFWDFGDGRTFAGPNPPAYKYNRNGNYSVRLRVRNGGRCSSDTVSILRITGEDSRAFLAGIDVSESKNVCLNEPAALFASGGTRYVWSPAEGLDNPNIARPTAMPSRTTTYRVRIFNDRGCETDTAVTVSISDPVIADFSASVTAECGKDAELQFTNLSSGNGTYRWDFGDGNSLVQEQPGVYRYAESGVYKVRLFAESGACSAVKELIINVDNIKIPNVITPNNDGKNDRFEIKNVSEGWKMEIFDRWGKRLFISENYKGEWAGKGTNTTYFYRLTAPDGKSCEGWVYVLTEG